MGKSHKYDHIISDEMLKANTHTIKFSYLFRCISSKR